MNLTALHVTVHVQPSLGGMGKRLLGDGMAPRIFPVDKRMFYHKQWVAMRGKLLLIGPKLESVCAFHGDTF